MSATAPAATHDAVGVVAKRLMIGKIPKCSEMAGATPGDSIDESCELRSHEPSKVMAPAG
jgi:hypothetical protein